MEYLIVIIVVIAFNVFAASAKKRGGADGGSADDDGADMSGRSDSAGGVGGGRFGGDFDSDSGADVSGGYYPEAEMSRGDVEISGEDFDAAREFVEKLKRERAGSVRGGGMSAGGGIEAEENFGGNAKPFTYGGTLREVPSKRFDASGGGFAEDVGSGGGADMSGRSDSAGESRFDAELRMLRERSETLQNTLRSIRDFEEQNKNSLSVGGAEGAYLVGGGSEFRGEDGSPSEEADGLQSSGCGGGFFASKADLRRAVLASEILGKPVSLGK